MSVCHAAIVTRCDSRADFGACPAVATVRQESRSAPAPAVATVPQQEAFSALPSPVVRSYREAADYLTILPLILLLIRGRHHHHADHLLQLREPKMAEWLGEYIRELPTSFDKLDDDLLSARPAVGAATQLGTPLWPSPCTLPRMWTAPPPSISATAMRLEPTRGRRACQRYSAIHRCPQPCLHR